MSRDSNAVPRRIATVLTAIACIGVGALLVVAALTPDAAPAAPLSAFWNPQSWEVVTLAVVVAVALGLLVFPYGRRQFSARPFFGIAVAGTTAVGLGFAAYARCSEDSVPFWSPLTEPRPRTTPRIRP